MIILQNFIFPDPAICDEHDLYYRISGAGGFCPDTQEVRLGQGAGLVFDTYFNLLNIGKWRAACTLRGLYAGICGHGRVAVRVCHATPGGACRVLYSQEAVLSDIPYLADLSHFADTATDGLIHVEVTALQDGVRITAGHFATRTRPATQPKLAVSITTFRREPEIRRTVARFEAFLPQFEFGDHVHVQVVDNGHSADIRASATVTPLTNHNYGGAGGFARGLFEAQKAGFSHCLFMDDDASFHMENITRAYVFLALAKDRRAAVAGSMITNARKWAMWENGAWFDGSCHPMFCGTDLRGSDAVRQMEFESARPAPPTLYGGWWFFAFAIDQVVHYPFPFFVRGDDISFSLANDFAITTLNGVVSFQDDFAEKESPLTLYLDLRNHLVHHLVFDALERSALGTARVGLRFVMRSLLRFHYETARTQLLAWQDVMRGPHFFDDNLDMSARRAIIGAMVKTETWRDIDPQMIVERRRYTQGPIERRRRWGRYTLNGHLVPGSARRWDRIVLEADRRADLVAGFGAAQITYLNATRDKGYTVTQSKWQSLVICWQMTGVWLRFLWGHRALKAAYRRGYGEMTTRAYWEKILAE